MPKKFRTESQVAKLIRLASEVKIKKLKKYEDEYMIQKEENEKFERMLAQYQMKYNEDRKVMQLEIGQLQQRIKKFEIDQKNYESIIADYKQIIQRQELKIESFTNATVRILIDHNNSDILIKHLFQAQNQKIHDTKRNNNNTDNIDSLDDATQRIRELELQLARAKVAQVEAECQNQNLKHQLNSSLSQHRSSLPNSSGWKLKFDSMINNIPSSIPTFQSHISEFAHQLNTFDETK